MAPIHDKAQMLISELEGVLGEMNNPPSPVTGVSTTLGQVCAHHIEMLRRIVRLHALMSGGAT